MDSMLLPLMIACVAGLFVWGVVCVVQGFTDGDKKKLAERLAAEQPFRKPGSPNAFDARRSIVVAQLENDGLPPALAQIKLLQALQRRVTAAYPECRLVKFV